MLIASCQLLFFKDHAPTAWAGVGQEKPVLNDVILSFFIRFCQENILPYPSRLPAKWWKPRTLVRGEPAIKKRALALVIPLGS